MASPFADLNLSNPALSAKAKTLGYAIAETATVASIATRKDFNTLKPAQGTLIAESQDGELLRMAAKTKFVHLVNPTLFSGFPSDDGLIRIIAEQGKAFEIPLFAILRSRHVFRAKAISQIKAFAKRCEKLGAKIIFTSRAQSECDLKTPRETIAIASLFGLTREKAQAAISTNAQRVLGKAQGVEKEVIE